jgi:glycosyltransferase involved in cell wall biosynthesis
VKFLIHSNAPTISTGYGVQCKLLVDRLAADGHDVAVSATFGQDQGMGNYTTPTGHKVPVYWAGYTVSGDDIIHQHVAHFFSGDPSSGWIIPLLDVWSLTNPLLAEWNVAAWTPVDHDPVPPMVVKFFERTNAVPVAMSKHGAEQFRAAGLTPAYVPLSVDTTVFRPTFTTTIGGEEVSARKLLNLPETAFVVGMVSHNKDPNDRKGFGVALQAFARFHATHPNAVLFMHTEHYGLMGGVNIPEMATALGIPPHALVFSDQYAYRAGFPASMMAAAYTAMDVLLAPSAGEGFCVPLIEAQACGVPVIVSDFTAQPELVGAGWTVGGQKWWDQASRAWYLRADVDKIVDRLEQAYAADLDAMQGDAIAFAAQYDADVVFDVFWRPLIAALPNDEPAADKAPMTDVAVIIPAMKRPENVPDLVDSFDRSNDGTATLYIVCDADDADEIAAVKASTATLLISDRGTSFASKVNDAYAKTTESFLFVAGDDVEFTPGWLDAPRALSDRFDVIGTNDAEPGRTRNPKVANGSHADHFFIRRDYIDTEGGSLEGPGMALAEAYYHFYTDVETIQLAKARGVFTPCLASRVIHHHPGYIGREDLRQADPTYMHAVEFSEMDAIAFRRRAGLIDHAKVVRKDIWR